MPATQEDPRDSLVYEYTQTLDPKMYDRDVRTQLIWFIARASPTLLIMCKEVELHVELTENGNIHLHGFLYPKNYRVFIKENKQLKLIGFNKIVVMKDYARWSKYCSKDTKMMTDIINDMKISNLNSPVLNIQKIQEMYNIIDTFNCQIDIDKLIYQIQSNSQSTSL